MGSKQSAFSLLEVLIASAFFAFVAAMTVRAFSVQQQRGAAQETKTQSKAELTELRNRITRGFKERLFPRGADPNPPFQTPGTTAILPGAACTDLKVAVRVPQPPPTPSIIEWIGFHTECGGTCVRIRRYAANAVTQVAEPVNYPRHPNLKSVSICFQNRPDHIIATISGTIVTGKDTSPASIQIVMPKKEASDGVELLPN